MNIKPDLIETAINVNKQMDDLDPTKLYVKEQLAKDHSIKRT
jgi:hypothetical protein